MMTLTHLPANGLRPDWPSSYRGFTIKTDPRTSLEGSNVVVKLNLCAMSPEGETFWGDSWQQLKAEIDADQGVEN